MNCRECSGRMLVSDSRSRKDGATRRRYFCPSCGSKLTTVELPVEDIATNPMADALTEILEIAKATLQRDEPNEHPRQN